jgi:diguanylate cyclase (GGDEF)-like protein
MGYGYHYISLPDDYQNHTLSIALCVGENNAFTSLAPLRIYDSNYMIRDFISQQRFPLFINSFLIVFGVCLSVISLIYMSQFDRLSSILCLCLFSITIGIWSMCNLDLFFLYSYDYEAKTYLEFVCIYLAPIFFTLYFWNDIRSRSNKLLRYSYHFLLIAQIVFFVLALFLQITDICHLPRMLQLNHLLLLTLMIFILIMLIHDTRKKHVKSLFLLIGMISMILIGMIDIIRFNVMKYLPYFSNMHFTSITVWGLLIFIFSLIVDYSLQMQQGMYEIARTETLERMAYLDVLTDLYNRRKCEDLLDSLDHGTTDYGILNFDLNNLKMTNDQLGHATGDLLIQNFSALLLHTFQPFGSVGRIGGDEFIVILPDIAGIDINALLRQLHDKIMIYNESHESLRISVAHGYCASVEPEIHTARDAYKVADKRMYLQKTIMKKATLK